VALEGKGRHFAVSRQIAKGRRGGAADTSHTLLGQGAEVQEVAMGAGRMLRLRNAEAEIGLVPADRGQ